MSEQRFISEMFQVQPPHWGLRGDPFLWEDMKQAFAETPFPYSAHELVVDVHRIFREKTGEDLTNTRLSDAPPRRVSRQKQPFPCGQPAEAGFRSPYQAGKHPMQHKKGAFFRRKKAPFSSGEKHQ